jgi:hypothetical protein
MEGPAVTDEPDQAEFSFTWLALRLLGSGLYSNPWSALSELVANGIDAGAQNVYVHLDARNNSNATVEVIDDGTGMSRADIETYVTVGYNKRSQVLKAADSELPQYKGRKGIGKLAALFLSNHYFIQTRTRQGETAWELDARESTVNENEFPRLISGDPPSSSNDELWAGLTTGTRLTLLNVDLTGYGQQSMSALGSRLANQFLLPTDAPPRILLSVRTDLDNIPPDFAPVQKIIAFGNFVTLLQNFPDPATRPIELEQAPVRVMVRAPGLPDGVYEAVPTWTSFRSDVPDEEALDQLGVEIDVGNQTYAGRSYELTGWIGLHASISSKIAKVNDERFQKNKYYNPAQIRVYVRGKLASEHLLAQLGITGTYANYVEGEISFDLLDDDSLPDIATSNRQDFDETDGRVRLLRGLVRPLVRRLIQERTELAARITEMVKVEKDRRETSGKRQFSEQLRDDLALHPEIPAPVREELEMVISNKIQGDVVAKSDFRVFLSHASADKVFAMFIDELLRDRGATRKEIFFTSRTGETAPVLTDQALSSFIRDNLVSDNTLIFYMTSKNFRDSEFCLFEGGAGWATRSVGEYLKLNVDFDSIPRFLANGRAEVMLLGPDGLIELRPNLYGYLVEGILNPMIAHLNRGRDIAAISRIDPFDVPEYPGEFEMLQKGLTHADYFDSFIVQRWHSLVKPGIAAYLTAYNQPAQDSAPGS